MMLKTNHLVSPPTHLLEGRPLLGIISRFLKQGLQSVDATKHACDQGCESVPGVIPERLCMNNLQ